MGSDGDKSTGGEVVSIHRFAAKTAEGRKRQTSNLTPAAAVRHGAYSADRLQPERERVLGELLKSFGSVRRDRLEILASQRARISLLTAYIDTVGVLRHRGRGETFPAVALLQREETAYRAELSKIEELQQAAGAMTPGQSLEAIVAEYADDADGEDDDGDVPATDVEGES